MRNAIDQEVDNISEVMVHAINFDRETLANLSDWFRELGSLFAETVQTDTAAVAEAAARALDKMISYNGMAEFFRIWRTSPEKHRSYELGSVTTNCTDVLRQLLVSELESIGHFQTGGMLCQEILLNLTAENLRKKLLI